MGMPSAPDPRTLPPHIVVGDTIYWAAEVQGGVSDTWRKVWRTGPPPPTTPAADALPASKPKPGSVCRLLCLLIRRPVRERLVRQLRKRPPYQPNILVFIDEATLPTDEALKAAERLRADARMADIARRAEISFAAAMGMQS